MNVKNVSINCKCCEVRLPILSSRVIKVQGDLSHVCNACFMKINYAEYTVGQWVDSTAGVGQVYEVNRDMVTLEMDYEYLVEVHITQIKGVVA
jgi:uncharacterized protein CbrC (UPF0167 family)